MPGSMLMCDTLLVAAGGRVLFAKNSDRDPNEAQRLEWHPRRVRPPGARVRCTWIDIPEVRETNAVMLSRPFWMWGAEIGANEHGVTIGNEAVFTHEPYAKRGLTGMDLVRLALERASSASDAVHVITSLLEAHGQGGGCGHEDPSFTYHNSFGIADPTGAYALETAGKHWTVERVEGARCLSNALTIEPFAHEHGDRLRSWVARAGKRRARSQSLAAEARGAGDLMRALRDHGPTTTWPRYRWLTGGMGGVCMHAGGVLASSQTTASWVAELGPGGARHWVTGTAAPCLSLFKPVSVLDPLELDLPTDVPDAHSLWWRHERLHRRVMRDPARLGARFLAERDEVEKRWVAAPPEPREAFAEHARLLAEWTQRLERSGVRGFDVRPRWVRRYWERRAPPTP